MSKEILYCMALFILFAYGCSEEKPKVKVINESEKRVDAYFILEECACPAFSFRNIFPSSGTDYQSCSAREYIISIRDSVQNTDTILNAEYDKKYDIFYTGKSCSIKTSDQ